MVVCIAAGIWDFTQPEQPAINEKISAQPPMPTAYLEKIKVQQTLVTTHQQAIEKKYVESEQMRVERQRQISEEAQRQKDLREDRMIYRMKGKGDTSIDACYKYHSRYKTNVEEMSDCIARQLKYESSRQK